MFSTAGRTRESAFDCNKAFGYNSAIGGHDGGCSDAQRNPGLPDEFPRCLQHGSQATAWLLKDIGFVFVAGSLLLVDTELTLNVCDLVFRCVSSFVSAALLASLMDKKASGGPMSALAWAALRARVFEGCYWAHMRCVPMDLALATAYVVFKKDMGSSTSHQQLVASGRASLAPRGLELNATVANGTNAGGASSGTEPVQTTGHDANLLLFALWKVMPLRRSGGDAEQVQIRGEVWESDSIDQPKIRRRHWFHVGRQSQGIGKDGQDANYQRTIFRQQTTCLGRWCVNQTGVMTHPQSKVGK
ncbi:hypothetical protein MRX96_046347 [Rhipicephalus microplus]